MSNNNSEDEDSNKQYNKALINLTKDLRHTHNQIADNFDSLRNKEWMLIRTNFAIIAILVTAYTFEDFRDFVLDFIFLGMFILLIGLGINVWSSRTKPYTAGVAREEYLTTIGEKDNPPLNETAYLLWIGKLYTNWIDDGATLCNKKAFRINISILFLIAGGILVGAAIIIPLVT